MCYVHFIKQRFAQHTRTHTQETWCRDTHATANWYQHGLNIGAYSLVPLQLWSSLSLRQRWSVSHQRLWFCAALCLFSCFRLLNNLLRNIHIYTRETWCCDISPRPIAKSRRHTHTHTHTQLQTLIPTDKSDAVDFWHWSRGSAEGFQPKIRYIITEPHFFRFPRPNNVVK